MTKLTWKKHVRVEENSRTVYNIGDIKPKKKKFKLKLPRNFSASMNISKDEAPKIIRFITLKLDFDLLDKLLDNGNFVRRYLTLIHLEIIVGCGLISGFLPEVKKLFQKATKMEKFEDLKVTDAFYFDLIGRKKKNIADFDGLLLITIIRQGDSEVLKFALENLSEEIKIGKAQVRDGDMAYSVWAKFRNMQDLTPEDKLAEAIPKNKAFDSYFEIETPLTALLKNRESLKSVEKGSKDCMLTLLLKHGANPLEHTNQAFKVAARIGLSEQIDIMLKFIRPKTNSIATNKLFSETVKEIYNSCLAYGATENQTEVIDYVRRKIEKKNKRKSKHPKKTQPDTPRIGKNIEDAVRKLMLSGVQEHCSFRYRLLNGVFNLMNLKFHIEQEAAKRFKEHDDGLLIFASTSSMLGLTRNRWKRSRSSNLSVNETVDYNVAFETLRNKKKRGLGAQLNRLMNVNLVANNLQIENVAGSRQSTVSYASSKTGSNWGRKKILVKPSILHKWLLYTLQKNDYNGEKVSFVLLNLGLKQFIGKGSRSKRNRKDSDVGSSWDMESQADSTYGDDEPEDDKYDAISEKSDSDASFDFSKKKKLRRKSTLADVANFFKDVKANVTSKISSKKITSKDKVLLLSAASEFGSKNVLNELLELIAPELSGSLMKCCYLATVGEKTETQGLLLSRITKEVYQILHPTNKKAPLDLLRAQTSLQSSRSLRGDHVSLSVSGILQAFEDYKLEVIAVQELSKKKQDLQKRHRVMKGNYNDNEGFLKSTRKSISAAGASARRKSGEIFDLVVAKFKPSKSKNKARTLGRKRKTQRKSLFTRGKRKNKNEKYIQGKIDSATLGIKARNNKGSKKNKIQEKLYANKKALQGKGKRSLDRDPLEQLEEAFSEFLLSLLDVSCTYASFGCAKNVLKVESTNKEESKDMIVNALKVQVGKHQKVTKDGERVFAGLIGLLKDFVPEKDLNLPQIARDVLEAGSKHDLPNITNLTKIINNLSKVYSKKFLTLQDLLQVLVFSTKENSAWDHWPEVVELVFENLAREERGNIEDIHKMIKTKKLKGKLSTPVVKAVKYICSNCDDNTSAKNNEQNEGRKRRKSSIGGMINSVQRSLSRRGSRSSRGSMSKKNGKRH